MIISWLLAERGVYFICLLTALTYFGSRRLLHLLRYYQQHEYDSRRFVMWLLAHRLIDRRVSLKVASLLLSLLFISCAILINEYFNLEYRALFGESNHLAVVQSFLQINAAYFLMLIEIFSMAIVTSLLIRGALSELNPLRSGKKSLVMTQRARRIYRAAQIVWFLLLLLAGVLYFQVYSALCTWVLTLSIFPKFTPVAFSSAASLLRLSSSVSLLLMMLMILLQLPPLVLIAGKWCLNPHEKRIQSRLLREARGKLAQIEPTVIAVTGSYGKTSFKHILGHILGTLDACLITPGSVNTVMGITRIVRQKLSKQHRYFIVEMGAYRRGSIQQLCNAFTPQVSVVTTIGHAHYERFKSLEEVASAKSEIIESLFERGGRGYLGRHVEGFKPFERLVDRSRATDEGALSRDLSSSSARVSIALRCLDLFENLQITHSLDGLNIRCSLIIDPKQSQDVASSSRRSLNLDVPLFGRHQVDNILLALYVAHSLGYDLVSITEALKSLPQIEHRLKVTSVTASKLFPSHSSHPQLTSRESSPLWIDDAFNSNPEGFKSALDLLNELWTLRGCRGRRILITPGMVELGELHNHMHAEIGRYAASRVDLLLVVGAERIPSFLEAFNAQKCVERERCHTDAFPNPPVAERPRQWKAHLGILCVRCPSFEHARKLLMGVLPHPAGSGSERSDFKGGHVGSGEAVNEELLQGQERSSLSFDRDITKKVEPLAPWDVVLVENDLPDLYESLPSF